MASPPGLGQPGSRELRAIPPASIAWIRAWLRAVIGPAYRRAGAAWVGCAFVVAIAFGPTAMTPHDLTQLALHEPGVAGVLGATWLLIFVPTARLIIRPSAAYLASLPGDTRATTLISALALIGLQLPWLVLWIWGEGARGAALVGAMTLVIAALARWQPPIAAPSTPRWRTSGQALRALHRAALRRRAGDALVRGVGLAILAGVAAGFLIRNNQLAGPAAGVYGAGVIAIVLIPAQVGPALVTLAAYRDTAWLAASTGMSPATRRLALVATTASIHLAAAAIASIAAAIIAPPTPWLGLALGGAIASALGEARTILVHEASPTIAARVVVGAVATAAVIVLALATLDAPGIAAAIAVAAFALIKA